MSDSSETLQKWRKQGSLRYLAQLMRVTTKQVTRYWDKGWIDGRYRTAKGHRRVRYTADTVERVKLTLTRAKETNIAIRYRTSSIDYDGILIPVEDCTTMEAVYLRARAAGLDERQARDAARIDRVKAEPTDTDLASELLLRAQGTSQEEVDEDAMRFRDIPLEHLLTAADDTEFRARAQGVWQKILSTRDGRARLVLPQQQLTKSSKTAETLRTLLSQPDRESFIQSWLEFTELQHRIGDYDDKKFDCVIARANQQRKKVKLETASLALKQSGHAPSAAALARALGISRPALYRGFGRVEIQAALRLLRNDAPSMLPLKPRVPEKEMEIE